MNEEVAVKEQLFKLLHAIEDRRYLVLSSEYFSRKLLCYLYDFGAFKPSSYNKYDPYNYYQSMLDMFNKKNLSDKQDKRTTAIILGSIKPFLQDMLSDKMH